MLGSNQVGELPGNKKVMKSQGVNIRVPGSKMGVVPLNDAHVVTKPLSDLENGHPGAGEDRSEGMAHDVRRHPRQLLGVHVVCKRASEIVTVTPGAVRHGGFKCKIGGCKWGQEFMKKFAEGLRKRNRALVAVLGSKGQFPVSQPRRAITAADGQASGVKVKPIASSLDNLSTAQTGIKAAVQDKTQRIGWSIVNKVDFIRAFHPSDTGCFADFRNIDRIDRIIAAKTLFNRPTKKGARRSQVTGCRAQRDWIFFVE